MKRQAIRYYLGLIVGLLLTGCSGYLEFAVRFTAIEGLRTGDRVWAETQPIGSVAAVDYSDRGDYQVAVRVEREHAGALGRESVFFIDADPQQPERKALMVIAAQTEGNPIEDGETLAGTPKWKALMQRMTRRMEQTVSGLAAEFGKYWQDIQGLSTSEQARRLEQELDRLLAELRRLSASARHELKTNVLPRLRAQLEMLRRGLEAPEHEDQLDRLQDKVERIDRELKV